MNTADLEVRLGPAYLLPPTTTSIERGEIVAVRGANGSGKTTLLRVIAGVVAPTAGAVRVHGEPVDERRPSFRRTVAALIGLPPLARDLTLEEHLSLVALSWGETSTHVTSGSRQLLESIGLGGLRSRFPHELSSGQLQLFAIATVLRRPSELILLDEPEQRLDDDHIEVVADALRSRVDDGAAVMFATHDPHLVNRTAARSMSLDGIADA